MLNSKQAKSKLIISIVAFIFLIGVFVLAETYTHTLVTPADDSWSNGTNVNFSGVCYGNEGNLTAYNVSLWTDTSGAFVWNSSLGNSTGLNLNNTYWSFSYPLAENYTGYTWNARCVNATDNTAPTWISGGNFTLKVDRTWPFVWNIYPANTSYWTNQTDIYFEFNATDTNPSSCYLYHNMSGVSNATLINDTKVFTNATTITFEPVSPINQNGQTITWGVKCVDSASNFNWSENYTLTIDYTDPSIAITNYTDNKWINSSNFTIVAVVSDYYPDSCELWSDVVGAGFAKNNTNLSVSNGTVMAFPEWNSISDNNTGISYNIWCNDSAGNTNWLKTDGNYTIYIDSVFPSFVNISVPRNNSYTADLSPTINWTVSSDTNFVSYILESSNSSAFTTIWHTETITNVSTNYSVNPFDLAGNTTDVTMYVRINSTDQVQSNMSAIYRIDVKQSCSTLEAGKYSYCSIVRDTNVTGVTMYQIGVETGADYVYKGQENHTWLTHTVGSTVKKYENFSRGDVAVIHVATADGNQSWNGYRVWSLNITYGGHATEVFNITNTTNSNWNLIPWINRTDIAFWQVENSMNSTGGNNETGYGNLTYFSYVNWNGTGLRYLPWIWGRGSPWNLTTIESGGAFWAAYDHTVARPAAWNWTVGTAV